MGFIQLSLLQSLPVQMFACSDHRLHSRTCGHIWSQDMGSKSALAVSCCAALQDFESSRTSPAHWVICDVFKRLSLALYCCEKRKVMRRGGVYIPLLSSGTGLLVMVIMIVEYLDTGYRFYDCAHKVTYASFANAFESATHNPNSCGE